MTYGKEILPVQLEYGRARQSGLQLPLRLRLFLFFLTTLAIAAGVLLAYLLR